MTKKIIELSMTNKQFDQVQNMTMEYRTGCSNVIAAALSKWYENNKEHIENVEEDLKIRTCNLRLDEKTEKILALFLNESMGSLLQCLNNPTENGGK